MLQLEKSCQSTNARELPVHYQDQKHISTWNPLALKAMLLSTEKTQQNNNFQCNRTEELGLILIIIITHLEWHRRAKIRTQLGRPVVPMSRDRSAANLHESYRFVTIKDQVEARLSEVMLIFRQNATKRRFALLL